MVVARKRSCYSDVVCGYVKLSVLNENIVVIRFSRSLFRILWHHQARIPHGKSLALQRNESVTVDLCFFLLFFGCIVFENLIYKI